MQTEVLTIEELAEYLTQSSRTLLLSKNRIWADDEMADEMLRNIYAERGRPEVAEQSSMYIFDTDTLTHLAAN